MYTNIVTHNMWTVDCGVWSELSTLTQNFQSKSNQKSKFPPLVIKDDKKTPCLRRVACYDPLL